MADGTPEVTITDRVEVVPTADTELVEGGEATPADSSQSNEGAADPAAADPESDPADASPDGRPEGLVTPKPAIAPAPVVPIEEASAGKNEDGLTRLPDETPREYALRLEVTRLRSENRTARVAELAPPIPAAALGKRELTPSEKAIIAKYKPSELAALREALPVLAKELGFVREEELQGTTYSERAQSEIDGFLEKHPEYLPENDNGNVLWTALRQEVAMYRQPANAKDYRKVLERAHQTVFGLKPSGSLPNNTAAARRIEVASHGGAAAPGASSGPAGGGRTAANTAPQAYRFDMLKGFSPEELRNLEGRAGD